MKIINRNTEVENQGGNMKRKLQMKQMMALWLVLVLVFTINTSVLAANTGVSGSGTKEDPYIITSAEGLKVLDQKDDYIYARLAADIDLSKAQTVTGQDDLQNYIKEFYGELDGNGHVICNAKTGSNLIDQFFGGELRDFKFDIQNPVHLVWDQKIKGENEYNEHKYTDITVTGELEWKTSNNNESPIVVYAMGDTTMTRVMLDLEMDSPTYHGLFVGYEPAKNSNYQFIDCVVKGVYRGSDLGVLFGNGSMTQKSDYGFHHVFGLKDVKKSSSITVKNMNLSEASILTAKTQPHMLCGVSYLEDAFEKMEEEMKSETTGYENMKKSEPLTGYSAQLGSDNKIKIQIEDSVNQTEVAYFLVASEVYSTAFQSGIWNGTQKHSVVERINYKDGVKTYYSTLGKIKFHDSKDGVYGTTGLFGETRTVTVNGETYYALQPDAGNTVYTFNSDDPSSLNTAKVSDVKVWAYDKDGHLLNAVPQKAQGSFVTPEIAKVSVREKTVLKDVLLTEGWKWVDQDTKVVLGGQTAFARNGEEIAPVMIIGEQIPVDSIQLDHSSLSMETGNIRVLKADLTPSDATDQTIVWGSSDEAVASVDQEGRITAKKAGTAEITAKAGEKTAVCKVSVYEVKEPEISDQEQQKPVDKVWIGVDQETAAVVQEDVKQILESISEGKESGKVSQETQNKLEEAVTEGKSITSQVVAKTVKEEQVEKNAVKEVAAALKKGEKVAQYLDLSVVLSVDGKEVGSITQLEKALTFQIAVPKNLQKEGRGFGVVRVHDGKAEKLPIQYKNGIVTFKTDRFSTYALIYEDVVQKEEPEAKPTTPVKKMTSQRISTRRIKVSWWRKKSADGFVIYAKAGKGKYKKIKTVGKQKSTTVTVKSGYSYKFKVRAYRNVKKGKKTVRKYWRSYRAMGKNGTKTEKIIYQNISGYNGYVVYMKEGKKAYRRVKTTTKGGTISYTNKRAKVGVSYRFILKGYKVKNGKRSYTTISTKKI